MSKACLGKSATTLPQPTTTTKAVAATTETEKASTMFGQS